MTDDMRQTAEALRDGEEVAAARHQAAVELEQGLVAQEQALERDTGSPIVEQADGGATEHDDDAVSDVVTAGQGGGSNVGDDHMASTIASPGAGTDPSETQTSSGGVSGPADEDAGVELEGDERTFEGDGRHPLDEQ